MAKLTAKEYLALSPEERERRKDELSAHECFLLRTLYSQPKPILTGKKRKMTRKEKREAKKTLEALIAESEKKKQ